MILLLESISIILCLTGGQVTLIMTDFLQSLFVNIMLVVIVFIIYRIISWNQVLEAYRSAPNSDALLHPFRSEGASEFNVWFFLLQVFWYVYLIVVWAPNTMQLGSARDAHEARMMKLMGIFKGAMGVGLAQGALDYAVDYSQQRVQFGVPISKLQAIRFMVADMSIQVEAARSLLYRTTAFMDSGSENQGLRNRLVSATKCFASDVAMRVTTDAVQILGGYGVMKDYPVERMMRDAKMIQIFDGSNQIQRVIVARSLLD